MKSSESIAQASRLPSREKVGEKAASRFANLHLNHCLPASTFQTCMMSMFAVIANSLPLGENPNSKPRELVTALNRFERQVLVSVRTKQPRSLRLIRVDLSGESAWSQQ